MHHIYSTLSADMNYNVHTKQDKISAKKAVDIPKIIKSVFIKGGSGVANKRLDTPLGVRTTVTDEELEILKNDSVFQIHLKNGFMRISDSKVDPEIVAADMELYDNSSPVTPEDNLAGDTTNLTQTKIKPKKDRSFSIKSNLQ